MGNSDSKKECEKCRKIYGSDAILEIYHQGNLGGHDLCVNCFENYRIKKNYTHLKNKSNKNGKCCVCSSSNNKYLHTFKIHWFGKYNNMIMCETCLFDKSRRRRK